jgi:hypothetical protein
MTKLYYAFIGQNATTGKPHAITGYHSLYGDLFAFSTKRERDCFISKHRHGAGDIAVATNKRDAKRKYFKGMTQIEFDQYLLYVDNGYNQG